MLLFPGTKQRSITAKRIQGFENGQAGRKFWQGKQVFVFVSELIGGGDFLNINEKDVAGNGPFLSEPTP